MAVPPPPGLAPPTEDPPQGADAPADSSNPPTVQPEKTENMNIEQNQANDSENATKIPVVKSEPAAPENKEDDAKEAWDMMAKKRRRSRSRSRRRRRRGRDKDTRDRESSRDRDRRRRRRRSRSKDHDNNSGADGIDYGPGIRKRRRGERRHRNLWDVSPEDAEKLGLLSNLPINIGQDGDFMHADRAGRRIYVGNLPLDAKESEVRDFFNAVMIAAGGATRKPGNSVLGVFLNLSKKFGFVEFRNAVEATQVMDLDGIKFKGLSLKIGRPANYNPTASCIAARSAPKLNLAKLGIVPTHVPNGPGKIYLGGIPYNLSIDQVRELLCTYGPLRGLWLSHDPATGMSKGYGFAYYENEDVTYAAIQGLNGLEIGDRKLIVKKHEAAKEGGMKDIAGNKAKPASYTRTLVMLNMVADDDLKDPQELEDIKNDIATECSNYGKLIDIFVPGLNENGRAMPGTGKVYGQFATIEAAKKCKHALQGRSFADRTVVVTFYDDTKFQNRLWI